MIRVPGHNARHDVRAPDGRRADGVLYGRSGTDGGALPYPWIMGFDLYPLKTLENKKKWIPEAVRGEWLAIFGHEPRTPGGYLRERQGKFELEPVMIGV